MRPLALLLLAATAACAYDPPVAGDRDSDAFQRSIKVCRATAAKAQGQREGTPGALIGQVFDFHRTEHHDVETCMQARGYALK